MRWAGNRLSHTSCSILNFLRISVTAASSSCILIWGRPCWGVPKHVAVIKRRENVGSRAGLPSAAADSAGEAASCAAPEHLLATSLVWATPRSQMNAQADPALALGKIGCKPTGPCRRKMPGGPQASHGPHCRHSICTQHQAPAPASRGQCANRSTTPPRLRRAGYLAAGVLARAFWFRPLVPAAQQTVRRNDQTKDHPGI